MHVPQHRESGEVGFNMTPMIDIVFQLIIFFLLSSHLSKQENQTKLPLPVAESGSEAIDDGTPRVTINVRADGAITLGTAAVPIDDLAERLAVKRASAGESLEVRIRGDRRTPYRAVQPILLACARSGVWNVTFAVYRPEDADK